MNKPWKPAVLIMAMIVLAVTGQARAGVTQEKNLQHARKFKPLTIRPTVTVPSSETAREVGGIQYGRHIDVKLKDGTTVRCFPAAVRNPEETSKTYYYLPANPHVSRHPDGTPKFSLIRFVTDKTKEEGGAEGAVLHFLAEYGLSKPQQQETEAMLQKRIKGARLKGAVPLEIGAEGNSFNVISAVLGDEEFTSTLITSGKAPVMEGQQVAVAARLDAYGATLLAESFKQPTSQVSVVFDLKYVVKLPAYDVEVVMDFDRFHKIESEYSHDRQKIVKTRKYWDPKWYNPLNTSTRKSTMLTEEERSQAVKFLQETGTVTFNYIQHVPESDKEIVESGLHKLVLEAFFDTQTRLGQPAAEELLSDNEEDEDAEAIAERRKQAAKHNNYSYKVFQRKETHAKSTQRLNLKKVMARYEHYTMTGNVGAWYEKYKDDPRLVTEVNLDDPFFQRREMRFVIDNEAYDIFNEMVNYATVQVRVPRKDQRPFIDELTIDQKYLETSGQTATLTYARMGDDAQTYDYAVQWSLRGGHLYPPEPRWSKGELMAVTLAAPVRPRTLEAEADLAEMERLGIVRALVELRYSQFGKQHTDSRALALSPAVGEPLVNKIIYQDADRDALSYRVIYYHKKLGKITQENWQPVAGNYIYCAPSETVLEKIKSSTGL
ncbi:MAG: hypothetical protein KGY42_07960 [Desulfobacterales bacterium]|nr:hypothetical protein [Desulfobacterales bacterium]MBS3754194.1 hypothetical protein [Desulfobacterales bacterium]